MLWPICRQNVSLDTQELFDIWDELRADGLMLRENRIIILSAMKSSNTYMMGIMKC